VYETNCPLVLPLSLTRIAYFPLDASCGRPGDSRRILVSKDIHYHRMTEEEVDDHPKERNA
jgi:hypothetical protein